MRRHDAPARIRRAGITGARHAIPEGHELALGGAFTRWFERELRDHYLQEGRSHAPTDAAITTGPRHRE